ncbi:MAG: hypothetical protein ACFCD0_23490 [Gemmataceae bacterium]
MGDRLLLIIQEKGQHYLYHRVVPAVLKLDPQLLKAIPGRVLDRGRSFFQFAGTGQDVYPKP